MTTCEDRPGLHVRTHAGILRLGAPFRRFRDYAVHRTATFNREKGTAVYGRGFTVTHLASGLSMSQGLAHRSACRLAQSFREAPSFDDWPSRRCWEALLPLVDSGIDPCRFRSYDEMMAAQGREYRDIAEEQGPLPAVTEAAL